MDQVELPVGVMDDPGRGISREADHGDVMPATARPAYRPFVQQADRARSAALDLGHQLTRRHVLPEPGADTEGFQCQRVRLLTGGISVALHHRQVVEIILDALDAHERQAHGNAGGLALPPALRPVVRLGEERHFQRIAHPARARA